MNVIATFDQRAGDGGKNNGKCGNGGEEERAYGCKQSAVAPWRFLINCWVDRRLSLTDSLPEREILRCDFDSFFISFRWFTSFFSGP